MNIKIEEIRLLSEDELKIPFKLDYLLTKIGLKCAITDFAILLGGYHINYCKVPYDDTLKGRTGIWNTTTGYSEGHICCINSYTERAEKRGVENRDGGIRPVINYTTNSTMSYTKVKKVDGISEIKFGEYPQYAVHPNLNRILEKKYIENSLRKTGKIYTTDSEDRERDASFSPNLYEEYEYEGKKYVRVISKYISDLSNGININSNESFWIEVEPITWYLDAKNNLLLSKNILVSGIRYNNSGSYREFKNTEIYMFLNDYFKKEIIPSRVYDMTPEGKVKQEREEKKCNPFKLDLKKKCSEEMLEDYIEIGVPLFLNGMTNSGKTGRIKEIDPTCEIIYLKTSSIEELMGTNGEQDIPPKWLENVKSKCQKEPDKLHVIYFKELTSAPQEIQQLVFNIIQKKKVRDKWSIPENARIVASGNERIKNTSEEILNQFIRIEIETTNKDWVKWAARNQIHPSICSFIAYKETHGLRTYYTDERPNADPKKWEIASKILCKTGNIQLLRPLVGEELTNEFIDFCRTKVITTEDILTEGFDKSLAGNLKKKEIFATIAALSMVDKDNIESIRNFIKEIGEEYLTTFDIIWAKGDKERINIIDNIILADEKKIK